MSDNSFYFPTYTGLLTPEHKKKIGPALWEFLWCISKTTKEQVSNGEKRGIVLGGKPIKHEEVAADLGVSADTVKRNLSRLKKHGYIESKRAPYGEIIYVRNSKKFRKGKDALSSEGKNTPSDNEREGENALSEGERKGTSALSDEERKGENALSSEGTYALSEGDSAKMPYPDRAHMPERKGKNALCNKDIKDINTNDRWIDNINPTQEEIDCGEIEKHYLNRKGNPQFNVSSAEYQMILELLREGIPKADILIGIDSAFDYKGKAINSFAYCVKVIRRYHQQQKERSDIHAKSRHIHGRNQTKGPIDPPGLKGPFAGIKRVSL